MKQKTETRKASFDRLKMSLEGRLAAAELATFALCLSTLMGCSGAITPQLDLEQEFKHWYSEQVLSGKYVPDSACYPSNPLFQAEENELFLTFPDEVCFHHGDANADGLPDLIVEYVPIDCTLSAKYGRQQNFVFLQNHQVRELDLYAVWPSTPAFVTIKTTQARLSLQAYFYRATDPLCCPSELRDTLLNWSRCFL